MRYAKIIVKNDYEKRGDLVHRELIRAFKKMELDSLIMDDQIVIPGIISDKENTFYLPFTGDIVEYHQYEEILEDEFKLLLSSLNIEKQKILNLLLRKYIFRENVNLEDVSDKKDLADDRRVELNGYFKGFSTINPYQKGNVYEFSDMALLSRYNEAVANGEWEDKIPNSYNDFLFKCSEVDKIYKKVV